MHSPRIDLDLYHIYIYLCMYISIDIGISANLQLDILSAFPISSVDLQLAVDGMIHVSSGALQPVFYALIALGALVGIATLLSSVLWAPWPSGSHRAPRYKHRRYRRYTGYIGYIGDVYRDICGIHTK